MADTRGQAFTLEGVIGAMILLTAVLFALNSAVLLPSTGETGNQAQIEQEAKDVMEVAGQEDLSEIVRCYDPDNEEWFGDEDTEPETGLPGDTDLHTLINGTFADRDRSVNIEVVPADGTEGRIVYQGASTRDGVTVSRTVTLYEDDPLMEGSGCGSPQNGEEVTNDNYPVDEAEEGDPEHIYNVVEVRLTIR
ncbi:DUF7288 family protein [Natranaeroarchaeum sulfidigenes]|uniref:Putative pilin/flagellin n=1 Tax=Natranaeroarchaeum sulfidigenes TaxID=2784880 RepID=A0A897MM17_9EURY|nr:hypothetical protein [Natranaeroarchaeum sulfidigenes]QSG03240.1 putative pilin/flagellin [Natranaeroarchaeum sulfidigenes]